MVMRTFLVCYFRRNGSGVQGHETRGTWTCGSALLASGWSNSNDDALFFAIRQLLQVVVGV
jgi:hypothetical protein